MASNHTSPVEFFIEVCSTSYSNQVPPKTSDEPTNYNIKRNQRCWDFPNWRLHRAAAAPNNAWLKEMKQLQLGADVNCKDWKGRTALHEAAKAGNLAAARYLVSQGADIDAHDDNGSTPLVEAVRFSHKDLATFLIAERRRIDEAPTLAKRRVQQVPTINLPFWIILQAFMNRIQCKITTTRRNMFKWLLITMNVGLELCQAVGSEEAGDGKIGGNLYRKLTLGFSSISLVLSIVEVAYEAKKNGAKWRIKRWRYCFYYPGIHCRVFGSFTMWFGMIISTVQFSLNTMTLVVKRVVVKFDYLALLLAVCLLLAALIDGEKEMEKMDGAGNCVLLGECEADRGVSPSIRDPVHRSLTF